MRRIFRPLRFLAVVFIHTSLFSFGQPEGLEQLSGHQVNVYYSRDAREKAERMAGQLDKVLDFYHELIAFRPGISLYVLSPGDWSKHTRFPVYGMPHYSGNQTLFVASQDNEFWKSFLPPLAKLPGEMAEEVRSAYTHIGVITMEPFFDLLAIHELAHGYHIQDSLVMQRKWLGELFTNVFLHTYIAEKEPSLLPALTVFPRMVVSITDKASLKFTTLDQLEKNYSEIGQQYPQNYGWYQCRWHMAAAKLYDAAGTTVLKNLWTALKHQRRVLDEEKLAAMLSDKVNPGLAEVMTQWDK